MAPARDSSAPSTPAGSPKRRAVGLLETMSSLWALCAKHAVRASRKVRLESPSPRAALARPKQLLATISNKAIPFRHRKKADASAEEEDEFDLQLDKEFGEERVWQRTILMGDKCQPLNFSGVIYYDSNGKQVTELPARSPRASPLPRYLYTAANRAE
ncbi:uncharacterized protein LOC127794137 [Diospyros lotus]|uniref:uncharacterized protein LOC127794137 n=1 Tax=Diospyros lotus TaxID=55363 RepID=UPI002250D517|nr:uncharacterized protein LOC127794137 [Diospyros lotus]